MGFFRQEYWSGLSCLPPGDLPNPGNEPRPPVLLVNSFLSEPPGKPMYIYIPTLSFFLKFLSIMVYHRILNIVSMLYSRIYYLPFYM